MAEPICIVSPWYPTRSRPFHGAFVQGFVETVTEHVPANVDVLHLEAWGMPRGNWAQRRSWESLRHLVKEPLAFSDGSPAVHHLPSPVSPGDDFGPIARGHRRFLEQVANGTRVKHPVVHAHVGLGGGFPALAVLAPDTRFFVTEHATFLNRVFQDPQARKAYDDVLERADALLPVSELLRRQIIEEFPHHAGRVEVVPNPVDFDALPWAGGDLTPPRRWLYAGSLTTRKGVSLLIDAFDLAYRDFGDLSLTLVGEGPLRDELQRRVQELGLEGVVTLVGAVAPGDMPATYAAHDLLVHLSEFETFGMTLVEAVAVGIPVLATRCGGPEETLGPIEDAVGGLVPVDSSASDVAAAYGHLRERTPSLDLAAGRADLRARYGRAAVAARLRELYGIEKGH